MNYKKIIADYNDNQYARNMATTTISGTKTNLYRFFSYLEAAGVKHLDDIDSRIMLQYQVHLSKIRNKHGKRYNPRTQNYAISSIRSLFKYLRRCGQMQNDPTVDLELAKAPRPLPRNILSIMETESLLAAPNTKNPTGLRDRAILELLYATGIRRSECIGLDLADLNLDGYTVFIRDGKGGRDRVVPITKQSKKWIGKYIRTVRDLKLKDDDEHAIFINKYGDRLGQQGLWTMIKRRAIQAGIEKNISTHSIRHTTATHLADADCNLRYIQELLGHSRLDTTAIYISVSAKRLKDAISKYHPRGKSVK